MPTPRSHTHTRPIALETGVPASLAVSLAANEVVGRGQFATIDRGTGLAGLTDGTMPGRACAGMGDLTHYSSSSPVDGLATAILTQRWIAGLVPGDELGPADFAVPFWIADESTPGKLSNLGGNNRSIGGLAFGVDAQGELVVWVGPVAWLLARAAHQLDRTVGASYRLADGAANAATAETIMDRDPVHGTVTGIEFLGAAVVGSDVDNALITISKRDGAGGAPVTLATYLTAPTGGQGAISAFQPAAFALSGVAGALDLLETDVLTVTVSKGGAGQTLNGLVRVVQRVE